VRTFKVSWFSRFAIKEGIQDGELRDIVKNFKDAAKIALSATEKQPSSLHNMSYLLDCLL
jgi:hypothetical protein